MTDEEFEKELDKMYDELDQQQAEMEELGLINYGDTGYYWRNPEEYEKDKRICELESEIERLEYLLGISDKALELACVDIKYCKEISFYDRWRENISYDTNQIIEQYKQYVKERMKSE